MPHIVIKMYPGRSEDQKQKMTKAITESVVDIAGCDESHVSVGIEEIEKENWKKDVYEPEIVGKRETLYREPGYKS